MTGIRTPDELRSAIRELGDQGRPVLVEQEVTGAVAELLVSVRREVPIGLVLTVGAGGELVELLDDTATILLPALTPVLHQAVGRLRIGGRLLEIRGGPRAILKTLNTLVHRLITLMSERPELVEIEINPLIVTTGSVWAVDALVTTSP